MGWSGGCEEKRGRWKTAPGWGPGFAGLAEGEDFAEEAVVAKPVCRRWGFEGKQGWRFQAKTRVSSLPMKFFPRAPSMARRSIRCASSAVTP